MVLLVLRIAYGRYTRNPPRRTHRPRYYWKYRCPPEYRSLGERLLEQPWLDKLHPPLIARDRLIFEGRYRNFCLFVLKLDENVYEYKIAEGDKVKQRKEVGLDKLVAAIGAWVTAYAS